MNKSALFLLLFLVSTTVATAQVNPVLPDLAPRVVEITGDLSISFPSLSRQPLVGFNPPPRVPEIPSSREPFTELYKQATEELPPSPLTPPRAPEVSPLANRLAHAGLVEAGLGRYAERFLRGNMSVPLNAATSLVLSGNYQGTDGHEPFNNASSITSDSDRAFLKAQLNHRSSNLIIGGGFDVDRVSYSLFGSEHTSGSVLAGIPNRVVSGWNIRGHVGTRPGSSIAARAEVVLGGSQIETDLFDVPSQSRTDASQGAGRMSLSASLSSPISDGKAAVDGIFHSQKVDAVDDSENSISSGMVTGRYQFSPGNQLTLDAGLSVLGFDAASQTSGGGDRSLVFLSPKWNLTYVLQPGTDLSFSNEPELKSSQQGDVLYTAPFMRDWAPLQPVASPVNLRAGISWYNDFVHASAGFGIKNTENHRVIESPIGVLNGFSRGYLMVSYEEASITYLDASLAASITPGIQADAKLVFRKGRIDSGDTVIPNFSPVTFGGALALGLLEGRFLVKLSAVGEGARYADRQETTKLTGLFLFGAEGTWYVTPQAGILLGIRNMGSKAQFWENYEFESNVIYLGAKWRW